MYLPTPLTIPFTLSRVARAQAEDREVNGQPAELGRAGMAASVVNLIANGVFVTLISFNSLRAPLVPMAVEAGLSAINAGLEELGLETLQPGQPSYAACVAVLTAAANVTLMDALGMLNGLGTNVMQGLQKATNAAATALMGESNVNNPLRAVTNPLFGEVLDVVLTAAFTITAFAKTAHMTLQPQEFPGEMLFPHVTAAAGRASHPAAFASCLATAGAIVASLGLVGRQDGHLKFGPPPDISMQAVRLQFEGRRKASVGMLQWNVGAILGLGAGLAALMKGHLGVPATALVKASFDAYGTYLVLCDWAKIKRMHFMDSEKYAGTIQRTQTREAGPRREEEANLNVELLENGDQVELERLTKGARVQFDESREAQAMTVDSWSQPSSMEQTCRGLRDLMTMTLLTLYSASLFHGESGVGEVSNSTTNMTNWEGNPEADGTVSTDMLVQTALASVVIAMVLMKAAGQYVGSAGRGDQASPAVREIMAQDFRTPEPVSKARREGTAALASMMSGLALGAMVDPEQPHLYMLGGLLMAATIACMKRNIGPYVPVTLDRAANAVQGSVQETIDSVRSNWMRLHGPYQRVAPDEAAAAVEEEMKETIVPISPESRNASPRAQHGRERHTIESVAANHAIADQSKVHLLDAELRRSSKADEIKDDTKRPQNETWLPEATRKGFFRNAGVNMPVTTVHSHIRPQDAERVARIAKAVVAIVDKDLNPPPPQPAKQPLNRARADERLLNDARTSSDSDEEVFRVDEAPESVLAHLELVASQVPIPRDQTHKYVTRDGTVVITEHRNGDNTVGLRL